MEKKDIFLVKEIHSAFDREADMLVAMSEDSGFRLTLKEKAERLMKLGFCLCTDVERMKRFKEEWASYDFARKYREKYPNLKFITKGQLDELCGKYNLVARKLPKYIGAVPEQKLFEMEYWIDEIDDADFPDATFFYSISAKDESVAKRMDELYAKERETRDEGDTWFIRDRISDLEYLLYRTYTVVNAGPLSESELIEAFRKQGLPEKDLRVEGIRIESSSNSQLIIAAPESMFKKKPEPPKDKDPVVLQPVKGGYLVIAKWGEEAEDELLAVPEMN